MPKLSQLAAVLFDMDGTLLDSSQSVHRAWTTWAHRHNLPPADVLRVCHGRRAIDTITALTPHADIAQEVAWMLAREVGDTDGVVPIAGAQLLLHALPATAWAVVTSASQTLARARLHAAGLPMPHVLISADEVERGKPDPQGFLLAAHTLGAAPQACLVVEDTPAGLNAGSRANMQLLGIASTFEAAELPCEHVINDYTGLTVDTEPSLTLTWKGK